MKQEIKDAMTAAEMDERMVMSKVTDYTSQEALAAWQAISKADRSGSAMDACRANTAIGRWIDANEEKAMVIIANRKASRDAYKARCAAPKTAEEIEKMYVN